MLQLKEFFKSFYIRRILNNKGDFLPYLLVFLSLTSGIFTYIGIRKQSDLNETNFSNFLLVYVNFAFIILVFIAVIRRWFKIGILQKKAGVHTFKLQKQIVSLFSLISILPGILVAIFASLFFNLGVQAWFGEPVKNALTESKEVIQAYFREHEKNIAFEAQQISNYLLPKLPVLINDRKAFDLELSNLEENLFFNESLVLNRKNEILGKSYLTFALELGSIHEKDFKKAKRDGFITNIDKDRLRVLVLLDPVEDIYLYIGKTIDKRILDHLQMNDKALNLYSNLEKKRSGFEVTFLIVFSTIVILLLFLAIWFGLNIANRIVYPVSELIQAAQKVSHGNLEVYVENQKFNNELDTLIESFNIMTNQLKKQQSDLIVSQRKATWSDIARKIAHEIKNPLTPIQLSAERLKRRYLKEIQSDPKVFEQCINTIIRQVEHIETLVREFSSFARMPEAIMQTFDLVDLLSENIAFIENANSKIEFEKVFLCDRYIFYGDRQQISQVFLNLLQNSVNALVENHIHLPKIRVSLKPELNNSFTIIFEDNGIGFPKMGREKLTEPYYTTRQQGTGLGLAIVEKIVTDHEGDISFSDSQLGGAMVILTFKG
ncbi:MAG: HAMP domain-containing protein [Proteobacteria bacterium]|nr:HAMP domain-containing protein [Pseudomonadota bacterium]